VVSDPLTARSDRIIRRGQYTGESARTVRQQLRADSGPLMPVPTSQEQLELEAAVLFVWERAVSQVRPAADVLALEIDHESLYEFLAKSLPMKISGMFTGIPGLRPRPARGHLDLVLVRSQGRTNAVVRLRGVTKEQWREAEQHLGHRGTRLWLDGLNDLHPDEITALRNRAPQPAALMSAVLRRLPIWREATWLEVRADPFTLLMYWRGGPEAAHVAQMLEDPLCGIADVIVVSRELSGVLRGVALAVPEAPSPVRKLRRALAAFAPKEMSVQPRDPSPIPTKVWNEREMRDALARREISAVYRLLRRHGVSQRQIAALTGQSQSEVSEILKGRHVMAFDVLLRITIGLGVPRGYMGLIYDETTAVRATATADAPHFHDESVRRRKFLARLAAMTFGTDESGADSRFWVSQPPAPALTGMTDARQLESAIADPRTLAG
jgi:transcriptional regulator with XRE-family HTH domain